MEGTLSFVRAEEKQTRPLRALARASEAHWGFSEEFLREFDRTFNITEDFIRANPTYAAWEGETPLAFWAMRREDGWELEFFYIAEQAIGTGLGRKMWSHLTDWCRRQGIETFHFVTSPQAVGFYEKMGAVQDRMTVSSIDGRPIPHFVVPAEALGQGVRY